MEISDLVSEGTVEERQIEEAGLQYRFNWGYSSRVYKDDAGTLYMFDKLPDNQYRFYMKIEGGGEYEDS